MAGTNGRHLTGPPRTAGYRMPQPYAVAGYQGMHAMMGVSPGVSGFNLRIVEEMRADPAVGMCLAYKVSPIYSAEPAIEGDSPQVNEFVQKTIKRFWQKDLPVALECYPYGYAGSEVMYKDADEGPEYDGLKPLHPLDVRPYTASGELVYIGVQRVPQNRTQAFNRSGKGLVPLETATESEPAKGIWFVHNSVRNTFYGVSALVPVWLYWRIKNMPDGMLELTFKWLHKHSYSGMVVRHPTQMMADDVGEEPQSAQDYARQMAEQAKAGANFALPGDRDEHGNFLWDIVQYGKIEGDGSGLIRVLDGYIDKQIQRAMEIPDEVITHQGNTGGYSRSQVAAATYLMDAERGGNNLLERFDAQVVRPLVYLRFGRQASQSYEVRLKPLLQPEQPPGQGGLGGAPPMPGQEGGDEPQAPGQDAGGMMGGDEGGGNPIDELLGGGL